MLFNVIFSSQLLLLHLRGQRVHLSLFQRGVELSMVLKHTVKQHIKLAKIHNWFDYSYTLKRNSSMSVKGI